MGHSLGLEHTFSDELGSSIHREDDILYKQDIEKELDKLKQDLKTLESAKKILLKNANSKNDSAFSDAELYQLRLLDARYTQIQRSLDIKQKFNDDIIYFERDFVSVIDAIIEMEKDPLDAGKREIKSLSETENDIAVKKAKILKEELKLDTAIKGESLSNTKSQSTTLENYMDYNFNESGGKNGDVQRKVFYKSQWDLMKEIGKRFNYIEEIK